ncbi:MAG: hypothetical protein IJW82_03385 [Clostridia bacterium]|nr:hypothetical protein [Clostridia bacterium]
MKIYDMKNKDLRNLFAKFGKTTYGRSVFLISYCVPMFLFVYMVVGLIYQIFTFLTLSIVLFLILSTFILGNAFFYVEVRKFSDYLLEKENNKDKGE